MPQQTTDGAATPAGYHVPAPLTERAVWVVWVPAWDKTARAPWETGHMYKAEWAASKPTDPRTAYDKAKLVADMPVERIHETWPFPGDDLPPAVKPAVLLPNEWDGDPLTFVDLDDVRDPDTGAVSDEVWEIIDRLGGYTEVSRSGTGLHCWVRGRLPDGLGKFIADLDTDGQVELYDHGRMTGGTWRHVAGTPRDAVPERGDVIDALVDEYGDDGHAEQMARPDPPAPTGRATPPTANDRSPYFDIDLQRVADVGAFRQYRDDSRNPATDPWQGPHPAHGGTSTKDAASSNFNVDGDKWYCFAHGTGGGALQLVATLDGVCSCRECSQRGRRGAIYRDDEKLLATCLCARERVPGLDGATPPYAALRAVARHADLPLEDPAEGVIGADTYRIAEQVYGKLSPGDV